MEILVTYIWWMWLLCLGPSPFLTKTLKVQCLVQSHIISKHNSLTIILKGKLFISYIFSAFFGQFFIVQLFQALEEKLIPVTIFWIFSSFFSMLDLTAQILSCWSLISCSSSASSTLRGSTALSVALQHIKQHAQIQKHRRGEYNKKTGGEIVHSD